MNASWDGGVSCIILWVTVNLTSDLVFRKIESGFFRGVQLFLLLVNQTNKRTFLKSNAETNTTKIGSSSARKRNAMLMAFRWHAFDGRTLNAGLLAL